MLSIAVDFVKIIFLRFYGSFCECVNPLCLLLKALSSQPRSEHQALHCGYIYFPSNMYLSPARDTAKERNRLERVANGVCDRYCANKRRYRHDRRQTVSVGESCCRMHGLYLHH